jgi:hypothetical protein
VGAGCGGGGGDGPIGHGEALERATEDVPAPPGAKWEEQVSSEGCTGTGSAAAPPYRRLSATVSADLDTEGYLDDVARFARDKVAPPTVDSTAGTVTWLDRTGNVTVAVQVGSGSAQLVAVGPADWCG